MSRRCRRCRNLSSEPRDLAHAGKVGGGLWSAAASVSSKLATTVPPTGGGDGVVGATFRKMADPRNWSGGTARPGRRAGSNGEGPRFADLWDAERRYAGVLQAWINLRRRGLEHNAVVIEAWLQSARAVYGKTALVGSDPSLGRESCAERFGRTPPTGNYLRPSDPRRFSGPRQR